MTKPGELHRVITETWPRRITRKIQPHHCHAIFLLVAVAIFFFDRMLSGYFGLSAIALMARANLMIARNRELWRDKRDAEEFGQYLSGSDTKKEIEVFRARPALKIETIAPTAEEEVIVQEPSFIRLECPICSKRIKLPNSLKGKVIKCPNCYERIQTPTEIKTREIQGVGQHE